MIKLGSKKQKKERRKNIKIGWTYTYLKYKISSKEWQKKEMRKNIKLGWTYTYLKYKISSKEWWKRARDRARFNNAQSTIAIKAINERFYNNFKVGFKAHPLGIKDLA